MGKGKNLQLHNVIKEFVGAEAADTDINQLPTAEID